MKRDYLTYMTNIVTENTSREEISKVLEAAFEAYALAPAIEANVGAKVLFSFQLNGAEVSDKHGVVGTSVDLSAEGAQFKFIVQGLRNQADWHRSGKYKNSDTAADMFKKAANDVLGSFKRATLKGAVVDHGKGVSEEV